MTWAELERIVKKAGWKKDDDGGRHAYIYHPSNPDNKIPFSRHKSKEVPTGTADGILKGTGLK